jgi:hypothetical protein
MARRKAPRGLIVPKNELPRANAHHIKLNEFTPPKGITLEVGSIFRLRGWHGQWKFLSHTFNPKAPAGSNEWIDCVPYSRNSRNPRVGTRSVRPDRVVPERPKRRRRAA